MSITGTSPDTVQSLDFSLSRLLSWFCLDQIRTRFESGQGLDKIQISVLKLKFRKNQKIQKFWTFEFEKIEILNMKIRIIENLWNPLFFKFLNFHFFDQFQNFSKFFEFFEYFDFFEFFEYFDFFQFFEFLNWIWFLSRPSPD